MNYYRLKMRYYKRIISRGWSRSRLFKSYEDINITSVKNALRQPDVDIDSLFYIDRISPSISFLYAAVRKKDNELIDYLISKNANLNIVCERGTALFAAVYNLEIFKKLHRLGADINIKDIDGHSVLDRALYCYKSDVAEYVLQQGINVDTIDLKDYFDLLLYACNRGNAKVVELLLDRIADINFINTVSSDCDTLLREAIRVGNVEVAKFLISRGADINYLHNYPRIIMRDALLCDNVAILQYLISLDSSTTDVNIITEIGSTWLHWILDSLPLHFGTNMYSDLLDAGFDLNVKDSQGRLAVEVVDENHPGIIIIKRHIVKLISAGFTVCQRNRRAVENISEKLTKVCLNELEEIKIITVGTSNISYFRVLFIDVHRLAIRLKFSGLDEVIDKEKLINNLPLYGGMLFYKLSKVNRRIKYINALEEFFEGPLCKLGLPYSFVRELWYYFSNIELKQLISHNVSNIRI